MDECIVKFVEMKKTAFSLINILNGIVPVGDDDIRFDAKALDDFVKDLVREKVGEDEPDAYLGITGVPPSFACRTCVISKSIGNGESHLAIFRSYHREELGPDKFPIWEVARCTTAAQPFFKPIFIEKASPGHLYSSDSTEYSNPSEIAFNEAREIWADMEGLCLVSVGGGHSPKVTAIRGESGVDIMGMTPQGFDQLRKFGSKYMQMSNACDSVHEKMLQTRISEHRNPTLCYHRFNATGLNAIGLLEPEFNSSIIPDLTARYLETERNPLHRCARDLLFQGQRWEGRQMDRDEISDRYNINFETPLGRGAYGTVLQVFSGFFINTNDQAKDLTTSKVTTPPPSSS